MTKFYAASTNGFYSPEINGTDIPKDAVEITDEQWILLLEGQSNGKMITSDNAGNPLLKDLPPPTAGQQKALADAEKDRLIADATVAIAPLQDAVDLDMATDEEKTSLNAWKRYRVLLSRVDTSNPVWPVSPSASS